MNHPITTREPLTEVERDLMRGVEIHVRPLKYGWEASLIDTETDKEYGYTYLRDSALQAFIDGEALYFKELDRRILARDAERKEAAAQVEPRGIECHGRRF